MNTPVEPTTYRDRLKAAHEKLLFAELMEDDHRPEVRAEYSLFVASMIIDELANQLDKATPNAEQLTALIEYAVLNGIGTAMGHQANVQCFHPRE